MAQRKRGSRAPAKLARRFADDGELVGIPPHPAKLCAELFRHLHRGRLRSSNPVRSIGTQTGVFLPYAVAQFGVAQTLLCGGA